MPRLWDRNKRGPFVFGPVVLFRTYQYQEIIMKVFVQAKNESVVINDEITVTILDVNDENVILAIDAPEWVEVYEKEPFERSESMLVRPR
jgi:carbon storage regulator